MTHHEQAETTFSEAYAQATDQLAATNENIWESEIGEDNPPYVPPEGSLGWAWLQARTRKEPQGRFPQILNMVHEALEDAEGPLNNQCLAEMLAPTFGIDPSDMAKVGAFTCRVAAAKYRVYHSYPRLKQAQQNLHSRQI